MKTYRGLSSVMGSLILMVIGFVAWAALYHLGVGYLYSLTGTPEVKLLSTITPLNGGQVYLLTLSLQNSGYYPFTIQTVQIEEPGISPLPVTQFYQGYTSTPQQIQVSPATPYDLGEGSQVLIYAYVPSTAFQGAGIQPGTSVLVYVTGTYDGSTVTYQTTAEVV